MGGLSRFKANNHPQQIAARGVVDDIDDRATPLRLFADLDARFHFTLDAAATAANTKLPAYFDEDTNGLVQSWAGERVWINPPFSNLPAWVEKATMEASRTPLIVMLVPANRTEQTWWHNWIEPIRDQPGSGLRTEFLKGRVKFLRPGEDAQRPDPNNRPPFGVCLLIWEQI